MKKYEIPVPDFKLIKSEDENTELAEEINFPIVMKIVSPNIIHKTDAGGVKVGIKDEEETMAAYQEIIFKVKKYNKEARIEGIIAYPLIPNETEVIVGMIKDPNFGPVAMFGLGGIFVEVLKDVSFRIIPLKEGDVWERITEIKGDKGI